MNLVGIKVDPANAKEVLSKLIRRDNYKGLRQIDWNSFDPSSMDPDSLEIWAVFDGEYKKASWRFVSESGSVKTDEQSIRPA